MKYQYLIALLLGNASSISIQSMHQKQNLAQADSNAKTGRISLESQKTITDAVNDVLKVTQEREEDEGPKVAVHHTSSSSAAPAVSYGAAYAGAPAVAAAPAYPAYAAQPMYHAPVMAPMPAYPPAYAAAPVAYPAYSAAGYYPPPVAEHHHHFEGAAEPAAEKEAPAPKAEPVKEKAPQVAIAQELEAKAVVREPTPEPENESPNSSVLRAIASANEQSSGDKVKEQREVADKLEKLERQSQINDAINKSVKEEEQKVIEEANRRMAEVHSRKAQEANKAALDITKAKEISRTFIEKAKKEENDAINKVVAEHASAVTK